MNNNKGFSLVELIVVIAIMAILAAVAIPTFAGFIQKANIAADVAFVNDLTYAAEIAHAGTFDKVTDVKVTVAADGKINGASYKVGEVTVTIAKAEGATNFTATAKNPADKDGVQTVNTTVQNAAADTIGVADWDYIFKNYKGDTFTINSENTKELKGTK